MRRRGRRAAVLAGLLLTSLPSAALGYVLPGGPVAVSPRLRLAQSSLRPTTTSLPALGGGRFGNDGRRRNNNQAGTAGMRPRPPGGPLAEPGNNGSNNGSNSINPDNLLAPQIYEITQPQDLLDFVVDDERLSVIKVYASW